MKTCICGRTEIMWNTHKVGVTADNIVRYTVSSLTVLHTLCFGYEVRNKKKQKNKPSLFH